tara:strand:- start:629 stop:793 length:165 start_codon:yes stop_codon:yes gene_type:complete
MQISQSYDTAEGKVVFVGELEGVELDMVIQLGLLTLMSRGAIAAEVVPPQGEQH